MRSNPETHDRLAVERLYAGQSPGERRAARHQKLLDSAVQTFGTIGYAESTIEGLCAAAGVATRHFYELFDGREALLLATYDSIIDAAAERVVAARDAQPLDAEARARAGIEAYASVMLDDERKARIVHLQVIGVSTALERRRREVIRGFAAVLEEDSRALARAGRVPVRDRSLLSIALVGATAELIIDWVLGPRVTSRGALIDELVSLYVVAANANPGHRAGANQSAPA